jgi:hypothetical protein
MKQLHPITTKQQRRIVIGMLILALTSVTGCRICADCEDLAYPAYGGAWQRTSRDSGRVGSLFDPGGAKSSELVPRDAPPKPDELERQRQEEEGDKAYDPDRDRERQESQPETDDEGDFESKADELRDRKLEDIEEEKEDELRERDLDDINIRLIPDQPMPPVLR